VLKSIVLDSKKDLHTISAKIASREPQNNPGSGAYRATCSTGGVAKEEIL
jgi:hypothetical protein